MQCCQRVLLLGGNQTWRGVAYCTTLRDLDPGRNRRRQTAAQLLRLAAGGRLHDDIREKQLLASLHPLHIPVPIPSQWAELSRLVSVHGPSCVRSMLSQRQHIVPDIQGATECRCSLTASHVTHRFRQPQLNKFLADIFQMIPAATRLAQLPEVTLSRFDLFHAHLFCVNKTNTLGMLFHSKEYPAYDKNFPINLGFCQQNSPLLYDKAAMDFRNLLWFQGRLFALDVGVASVLYNDLIMDGLQDVRTVLESDFGRAVMDINYFASLPGPIHRKVFLC